MTVIVAMTMTMTMAMTVIMIMTTVMIINNIYFEEGKFIYSTQRILVYTEEKNRQFVN